MRAPSPMAPQDDRPRSTTARHWPGYLAVAAILAVAGVVVALLVFVDSENRGGVRRSR